VGRTLRRWCLAHTAADPALLSSFLLSLTILSRSRSHRTRKAQHEPSLLAYESTISAYHSELKSVQTKECSRRAELPRQITTGDRKHLQGSAPECVPPRPPCLRRNLRRLTSVTCDTAHGPAIVTAYCRRHIADLPEYLKQVVRDGNIQVSLVAKNLGGSHYSSAAHRAATLEP
jgi:hypothetical protein